jgi:isopentenyldiphosphate isomerase
MSEEKIILVDEDDNIIAHVPRNERKPTDIFRISSLWITNSKGDILLAQRHKNKESNPEKWATAVAGTNAEGETYESNIYKEAEEEIGLTGVVFEERIKFKKFDKKYPFFSQWYSCVLDWDISQFRMQEEEVQDIRWWGREELQKALSETPEIFTSSMPRYFEMFSEK